MEHDQSLCFCGQVSMNLAELKTCRCPCDDCDDRRRHEVGLLRIEALRERLEKAGIRIDDLTDIIWRELDLTIEAKVERVAREVVRGILKEITLVSEVKASSIDWPTT